MMDAVTQVAATSDGDDCEGGFNQSRDGWLGSSSAPNSRLELLIRAGAGAERGH
jgi:hypothetical protein